MRIARTLVLTLAVMLMGVTVASAQQPFVAGYFDANGTQETEVCQGIGMQANVYFFAVNFNAFLQGIEFSVSYPPAITWLADTDGPPVTIGGTGDPVQGFQAGWNIPQNGFTPLHVVTGVGLWECDTCQPPYVDNQVVVGPNVLSGLLRAIRFPDFGSITGVGLTALICTTVPTEETTWGGIKATFE